MEFNMQEVEAAFARHTNIVFEFSGGKDSTATLFLLKDYWHRMTVMWCAADPLEELRDYVMAIAAQLPVFIEVKGGLYDAVFNYGLPSDIVPFDATEVAHAFGMGGTVKLQDRYTCCYRSLMKPMHDAVIAHGATLVIRGQKKGDVLKGPLVSGDIADGIEFLYPIDSWTDKHVFDYLKLSGITIPRYYTEGMSHSFDCAECTAWMHEPRGAYLKKYYPVRFENYRKKIDIVAHALHGAVSNLADEVDVCEFPTS